MGIFAIRGRRSMAGSKAGVELSDEQRLALPPRFEAVGEALALGTGSVAACWEVGRELASVGVSLGETLDSLRMTSRLVRDTDPDFTETHAISVAWSESMLGYLHSLSCDDPLTGLASQAHVRGGLSDLYRGPAWVGEPTEEVRQSHALVVVESADPRRPTNSQPVLVQTLLMSRLGATARTVFSGTETIGRVGVHRVVVVAQRDDRLGQRVALLRRMIDDHTTRVWIEGLPGSDQAAAALLDELARV